MPARISALPKNILPQFVNRSLNNLGISLLLSACIPSSFVYGCFSHVYTTHKHEIALSKWGIAPWTAVITTTLLYVAASYVLSQELKKKLADRDLNNTRVTLGILSAGCLLSSVGLSYLPYLMLRAGSSKADQKNAYFNGNILMMTTLTIAGFIICHLNKARRKTL